MIKKKNESFSENIIKEIIFSIIKGLLVLSKMKILHKEICPHNTVFDSNWNAKIFDFGWFERINITECINKAQLSKY